MKKLLNHIFIDGLSGMALGLFSTLIVGTIIQQIGNLIGGNIGDMLFIMGKMAAAMTGAGIGVGVAHRYQESPLVVLSAATAGMTEDLQARFWQVHFWLTEALFWQGLENRSVHL